MMSGLISSHDTCKNLVVNPSDPGDLSGGRPLMVAHTSASVKRAPIPAGSRQGRFRRSRLIELERGDKVPRI
jgi:hypothetical protein